MKLTNVSFVVLAASCIVVSLVFSDVGEARPAWLSFPRRSLLDTSYSVVAGDTGSSIAQKFGISFNQLSAANPGVNWNNLQIGQVLNIPNGGGSGGSGSQSYTVVAGDTGNSIASKFGISFSQLQAANPSVNWNNLQIGQVLNIPSGGSGGGSPGGSGGSGTYTVVSGDTGSSIASKFGITFSQLSAANPGVNWNNLQVGQVLNIPSGGSGGSPGGSGSPPAPNGPAQSYSGPASSFPDPSTWQSFDTLWSRNSQYMRQYTSDSDSQISWIQQGINQVSGETNPHVDSRVILCVIMQESGGNVYVGTTNNGVSNPGLMQSHNGVSFDPNNQQGSIVQMIRDGTKGTASGDGLMQLLGQYGNIYAAMRGYNSGSVDPSNLSNGLGATASYVSDIANRLLAAQGH